MPYAITEECLNCGSCEIECSFGAVFAVPTQRTIDAALCRDCGACATACPVNAIRGPLARTTGDALIPLGLLKTLH